MNEHAGYHIIVERKQQPGLSEMPKEIPEELKQLMERPKPPPIVLQGLYEPKPLRNVRQGIPYSGQFSKRGKRKR